MLASNTPQSNHAASKATAQALQSEYETHPTRYPIIKSFRNRKKGIKVNGIKAIRIDREMDINTLAERTGVTAKRLLFYNDVKSNKKAQKGELWYLRAKRSKAQEAYHIVEAAEDLWTISQKYGIKLKQLRKKNRIPKRQTTVKEGRLLWLMETRPSGTSVVYLTKEAASPKSTTKGSPKPHASEPVAKEINNDPAKSTQNPPVKENPVVSQTEVKPEVLEKSMKPGQKVHQVQSGETLYGIARNYGVSVEALRNWNQLDAAHVLSIGQELFVSPAAAETDKKTELQNPPESGLRVYVVQKGDTLYQIARQHQMTVQQLMELNQKTDFNLKIGEELKVTSPH
jgi:membrane-bound lytic murein transglycosylase D